MMEGSYEEAQKLDEQWGRSIDTSLRYYEKTGRLPTINQLRYWFRGSAERPELPNTYIEQTLGVASEELGVVLAYRYTTVFRIEGSDIAKRKYDIEWTLQYYAPYKAEFAGAVSRERKASRQVLRDIALEKGSWIPDDAKNPNSKAERVATGYVREEAYFKITDATRITTGADGKETSYEKLYILNNADVLRRIKEVRESGQLV